MQLAATLEGAFALERRELTDAVSGLNAREAHSADGTLWTDDPYDTEMNRLGAWRDAFVLRDRRPHLRHRSARLFRAVARAQSSAGL
ncbi:recombinase-like helix-turn-helix domain-containing protein [Streptomyces sp. NPDC057027]|uniref:recombinase-like helix-turn-helix domain-containing protein n=1 Tax=Streptomyces sp. NPDC057027 TaxID=3346004 RepID=UPI0036272C58